MHDGAVVIGLNTSVEASDRRTRVASEAQRVPPALSSVCSSSASILQHRNAAVLWRSFPKSDASRAQTLSIQYATEMQLNE